MVLSVSSRIQDKDLGMKQILSAFDISQIKIEYGILAEDAASAKMVPEGPTEASLGEVAIDQEFGIGTPERSFMRSTFDERVNHYVASIRKTVATVIKTRQGVILKTNMKFLGALAVSDVRKKILGRINPPLSESSIIRKTLRPGVSIETPLVWTGQLLESLKSKMEVQK